MASELSSEKMKYEAAAPPAGGRGAARWRMVYALGFKPWDKNDAPHELKALVEGSNALAPGRALDLGCGGGTAAIYMAEHGWDVTGVDYVAQALEIAAERAAVAGTRPRWVQGDVTRMETLGLGSGFGLCLDAGCFHSFGAAERAAYAAGLRQITDVGSHLLLFSFKPAFRGPAPRGLSRTEIEEAFAPDWTLLWDHPATDVNLPPVLRSAAPRWYCLRRMH